MKVGTIQSIFRYPVKAMNGEELESVSIKDYGLLGDRIFAWEKRGAEGDFLTVPELPPLLSYQVKLMENNQPSFFKRGEQRSVESVTEELSNMLGAPIQLVDIDLETGRPAYWDEPLLITTTASLKEIERMGRHDELDMLRFRPNLVVELEEDIPFQEEGWIGKELRIGETTVSVKKGCKRCAYVNVDPQTQEIDSGVLKTVVKNNNIIFGVYATVVQTGRIYRNDSLLLK